VHELPASRIRSVSEDESPNPFTVRANGTFVLNVHVFDLVGPATRQWDREAMRNRIIIRVLFISQCSKNMESQDGLIWPLSDIIANHTTEPVTAALVSGLLGACIILNVPAIPPEILMNIFLRFRLRVCADGGANVLFESMPLLEGGMEGSIFLPDVIIGDFDSIRPDVKSAYASAGVKIVQVLDQNNTDLDKALGYIESETYDSLDHFIVIAGSIGSYEGRIDQFFAVINSMYRYVHSKFRLISLGNESVMIVLNRGVHILNLPPAAFHQHCGLVPVFGAVRKLSTTGLRWNLDPSMGPSVFGGLVSTNNIIDNLTVTVNTSDPILFTFAYR